MCTSNSACEHRGACVCMWVWVWVCMNIYVSVWMCVCVDVNVYQNECKCMHSWVWSVCVLGWDGAGGRLDCLPESPSGKWLPPPDSQQWTPLTRNQAGQKKDMWASSLSSHSLPCLFIHRSLEEERSLSLAKGAPGYSLHPGNHCQGLGVLLRTAGANRRGQILHCYIYRSGFSIGDLETRD